MKRLTVLVTVSVVGIMGVIGIASGFGRHRLPAKQGVVLPNVPDTEGVVTLPNGWKVTPAGHALPLPGDLPLKMQFSPDGKYLSVLMGGYHNHGIHVLDVQSEQSVQTVDLAKDWAGMSVDPKTGMAFVSGGGMPSKDFLQEQKKQKATAQQLDSFQKPVLRLQWSDGQWKTLPGLVIAGLPEKERFVAGVAVGKAGELFVVNTLNDTVYRLEGTTAAVQAKTKVGYRPYGIAVAPDGEQIAVTNWGEKSVSLLEPKTLKPIARIPVGVHPNELVYGQDGRLFVSNAGSNSVSVIVEGKVTETIKTSLDPNAPVGSTPDAIALAPDGSRLYVANAGNNSVAMIDISHAGESKVLGFIPTGWYPSALAVSP